MIVIDFLIGCGPVNHCTMLSSPFNYYQRVKLNTCSIHQLDVIIILNFPADRKVKDEEEVFLRFIDGDQPNSV